MEEGNIMPLWIVIMVLGASGCGFLFLKARETERQAIHKKITGRSKTVEKAAKRLAAQPSGVVELAPVTSEGEVNLSRDMPGILAREIAEIVEKQS